MNLSKSRAGSAAELREKGQLVTKVGSLPVVVFWHDDRAWAIEDRCPHMGFPLHRGTVESGMVTCHWHHARFDLESGCTLNLFADDAKAFDVEIDGDDVFVEERPAADRLEALLERLREGLEDGLSLVTAKAVLGLLDSGVDSGEIVRVGVDFGVQNRVQGWGFGLSVLTCMANVLPHLDDGDRPLALVHGLAFVSRDTIGRPPRFPVPPLRTAEVPAERLSSWFRRFAETRSEESAERALTTALATSSQDGERMLFAAITDHVFIDEGHTIDFANKAVEVLAHVGDDRAVDVLPTIVCGLAQATRSEESSEWRHPHDLIDLIGTNSVQSGDGADIDVADTAWKFLADDPADVVAALGEAANAGASADQLGRALAYAAALRIARFHTQNDHRDWDTVHHSFTTANAVHQALLRNPTPEIARGLLHGVMKVYLDRFLNVPAARMPTATTGSLDALTECWEIQGMVDEAGNEAFGFLQAGGSRDELIAALGHALLVEDAGFHWFQVYEAGVRQALAWPEQSEETALILVAVARFLAAHTPTRRELARVVDIATRLRRGEELFEEAAS